MANDFLSLRAAAALIGVRPEIFEKKAALYGIPPLMVMNRPVYRREDIQSALDRLWTVRNIRPQITDDQIRRSVDYTNALISRLLNGSRLDGSKT